jgi:uncharacterized damage-inducible protein DinB
LIFRHNLWANLKLLDVCAGLDEARQAAAVPGTFGTVRDTWGHVLANEERYARIITGAGPAPSLFEIKRQAFPGWDLLRERARLSGEALIRVAESAHAGRRLRGEDEGEAYDTPIEVVLLCVIAHAVEHRTHIATTLSAHGVTPPELDAWAHDDETRAKAVGGA